MNEKRIWFYSDVMTNTFCSCVEFLMKLAKNTTADLISCCYASRTCHSPVSKDETYIKRWNNERELVNDQEVHEHEEREGNWPKMTRGSQGLTNEVFKPYI